MSKIFRVSCDLLIRADTIGDVDRFICEEDIACGESVIITDVANGVNERIKGVFELDYDLTKKEE